MVTHSRKKVHVQNVVLHSSRKWKIFSVLEEPGMSPCHLVLHMLNYNSTFMLWSPIQKLNKTKAWSKHGSEIAEEIESFLWVTDC